MEKPPAPVPEKTMTPRAAIREALRGRPISAHEISQRVGVSEKDVAEHLEHLEKSLRQKGEKLIVKPAECLSCGFVFKDRKRLSNPGSCPECREEHIAAPTFAIKTG